MPNSWGHKRRSAANVVTLGDISTIIEMARLEAAEACAKDAQPEACLRGVESMRSKIRAEFESIYEIKLPEIQAVRRKDAQKD